MVYLVQKQKAVLRYVAKNITEPMNLDMVMDKARIECPRLSLTERQARSVISQYQIGVNLFCGNNQH